MSELERSLFLPYPYAVQQWDGLVKGKTGITHACNPRLFSFYRNYLHLDTWYLILTQNERAIGLFPCTFTGKSFISMPHLSYGGIHWLSTSHPDTETTTLCILNLLVIEKPPSGYYGLDINKLKPDGIHIADTGTVITVRSMEAYFKFQAMHKATYWMILGQSEADQLLSFSSNVRRKIRASSKKGIEVKLGNIELLNDFYPVYQRNMRRLGSPAFRKNFFKQLFLACSKKELYIAVAYHSGVPVGSAFWYVYHDLCENDIIVTDHEYNHLYTSYALHWEMIKEAIIIEKKTYSFGRSSIGSSFERYKIQWPVNIIQLYYNSTIQNSSSHLLFSIASGIWSNLPKWLTNFVGPVLAKRLY